ncbi:branched-chain amino acid ABC transporter permease [Candidatus Acetothermia bacterium]|nr:branched-chain amino acid ABC transporter permease [Candidatus Acetothermia bacterium]MBI3643259.1 branched-chain amino acid ABC transporter permease [Candidatus Acetothermia bacterium]
MITRKRTSAHAYLILVGVLAILAILPWLGILSPAWYRTLIAAQFLAIFAMSWDLLGGCTGQVNLGQALFIGGAAYASGLIGLYLHWPPLFAILAGALAAMLIGLLVVVPAIRLRGPYLALVTLIALIAALKLVLIYSDVTGGLAGFSFKPNDFFPPLGYSVPLKQALSISYYYALGLLALLGFAILWITRSRWGAIFEGIREDEMALAAVGVNPAKFKILAFLISSGAAGLAGAAYVHLPILPVVQPAGAGGVLSLDLSLLVIVASVVGGLGTIVGPLIGAFVLKLGEFGLNQLPSQFDDLKNIEGTGWITLVFLLLLIFWVRFMPRGLVPTLFGNAIRGANLTLLGSEKNRPN